MNKLPLGTKVRLRAATYKNGSPVQGIISDYTEKGLYIVEIQGPHVAFYVEDVNSLSVSSLVVHPDMIVRIG